jgi:chromosome segregation protein
MVLAQANGHVGQQGSVADYLDVEPKYERAVEASLGDLLQHVIVPTHEQARAGLDLIRQENVGRCGFVVLSGRRDATARRPGTRGSSATERSADRSGR